MKENWTVKDKKIRVISYGLGPIGMKAAGIILDNPRLEMVAAIDIAPEKVGKDLGLLLNLNKKVGIAVSGDANEILSSIDADVVLLTTGSIFEKIYSQIRGIVSRGINCISSAEEMFFPYLRNPRLSQQLDNLAKEHSVTVLATGVNPGFVMDTLPLFLTGVCQKVKSIHIERVVDASTRRLPLQTKIGVTLTPEKFREGVKKKRIGHVGLAESLAYLARNLGWQLDNVEETIDPIVAGKDISTQYFTIKKNQVVGIKQIVRGIDKNRNKLIRLDLQMYVGARDPHDLILIKGEPDLRVRIKGGIAGDIATAAILVNSIPLVVKKQAGLITTKDLPLLKLPATCSRGYYSVDSNLTSGTINGGRSARCVN